MSITAGIGKKFAGSKMANFSLNDPELAFYLDSLILAIEHFLSLIKFLEGFDGMWRTLADDKRAFGPIPAFNFSIVPTGSSSNSA